MNAFFQETLTERVLLQVMGGWNIDAINSLKGFDLKRCAIEYGKTGNATMLRLESFENVH